MNCMSWIFAIFLLSPDLGNALNKSLSATNGINGMIDQSCHGKEKHFFLPKCYEKIQSASAIKDRPVNVSLRLRINSIESVDQAMMQFTIHGYIIQKWKDPRFEGKLEHDVVMIDDASDIWMPDLYCKSCREKSDHSAKVIRIFNTGEIEYSQLTKLTVACFMDLRAFPFDEQLCTILFGSYGYNDTYLMYDWDRFTEKPVSLEEEKTSEFDIEVMSETKGALTYWSGKYTILSAQLRFERKMGFFVIQCFLPMIILVMLSWVAFYLDPSDGGNRLMIGITLILTTVFLLGTNSNSLPHASYIKVIFVLSFIEE